MNKIKLDKTWATKTWSKGETKLTGKQWNRSLKYIYIWEQKTVMDDKQMQLWLLGTHKKRKWNYNWKIQIQKNLDFILKFLNLQYQLTKMELMCNTWNHLNNLTRLCEFGISTHFSQVSSNWYYCSCKPFFSLSRMRDWGKLILYRPPLY